VVTELVKKNTSLIAATMRNWWSSSWNYQPVANYYKRSRSQNH
jgi:hypothetical protein